MWTLRKCSSLLIGSGLSMTIFTHPASKDCQIPCYAPHSNSESYALFLRDQSSQTLDFRKSCRVPLSVFWGNKLCFYISFMMQTSAVPFSNGSYTKGVPFLSGKSLKRVRCWTSSGVSLQKLCCAPPWNTLPHEYGTPSQLRKYVATAPGQSAKIKRKSIELPHLLPPPHPCYILTILQNCQHDNSPKLSFMTHMSGQVVLI